MRPAFLLFLCLAACQPAALTAPAAAPSTGSATETGRRQTGAPTTERPDAAPPVPDGLPVVPGATRRELPGDDPELLAAWVSPDDGAAVYDFYASALSPAGFLIAELLPGGEVAIIGFATPGGHALQLVVTPTDAGTRIELRLADQGA